MLIGRAEGHRLRRIEYETNLQTTVIAIHIAPGSRLPMKPVRDVEAELGKGLVGDRYHGSKHRHVSVQSFASLREASELFGAAIEPTGTRRNITVHEGRIPSKPGALLSIGETKLEVVRIAAPCKMLDDEIAPGASRALSGLAGSICRILTGGKIHIGDDVIW